MSKQSDEEEDIIIPIAFVILIVALLIIMGLQLSKAIALTAMTDLCREQGYTGAMYWQDDLMCYRDLTPTLKIIQELPK